MASRTREAKFYNCKEQCSVQQPVSLKAEPEPQVRSQTFETLSGELSYTGPRFLTHRNSEIIDSVAVSQEVLR